VNPDLLKGDSVRFADKLYTAASPKTLTSFIGRSVLALLDTGTEVNVMSRSLAQTLGLSISENVALSMLALEGKESKFTGICTEVEVSIKEVMH
jgi:Aspartyl protease